MKTALWGSSKETGSEGKAVEFTIIEGEDGRTKVVDVTGPDGSSIQGGGRRDGFGGGGSRSYGGGYRFNGGRGKSGGVRGGGYGRAEVVAPAITMVRLVTWLGIAIKATAGGARTGGRRDRKKRGREVGGKKGGQGDDEQVGAWAAAF